MKNENEPVVILTRPQMGENIGAAARAMKNFGLNDLRLVAPRDAFPNKRAMDLASGAFDHMPAPKIFDTLSDALADCHYAFATTARVRDIEKPFSSVRLSCADAYTRASNAQRIAFVFGPERTGLENDEVALCHHLIHIPTDPKFSSLNLAQAVLLVLHEWFSAAHNEKGTAVFDDDHAAASLGEVTFMLQRLEDELSRSGFFKTPKLAPVVKRNIRAMMMRGDFTSQEVQTFQGIITSLIGRRKERME